MDETTYRPTWHVFACGALAMVAVLLYLARPGGIANAKTSHDTETSNSNVAAQDVEPATLTTPSLEDLTNHLAWTPSFADYPATLAHQGRPVPVDWESHPRAWEYRTRLRAAVAAGPNFAGAYTVLEVGCGTNCSWIFVVDARDGRVICPPVIAVRGFDFELESRLLVIDPFDGDCATSTLTVDPHYFSMEDGALSPVHAARNPVALEAKIGR